MRKIYKPILLKLCILIIFFIIYWVFNDHFVKPKDEETDVIDYFMLSTTIEAGVGVTQLSPATNFMKTILILQQLTMIGSSIFLVYIFGFKSDDDN
jgi:hypothetical protein